MALSVYKQLSKAGNFIKTGNVEAAKSIYDEILQVYPGNRAAKQALIELETSNKEMPNERLSLQDQGAHLLSVYNQGDYEKVLEIGQRMIRRFPNVEIIHNIVGAAYKGLGKLSDAVVCYRRAISINPRYSEAHNNLGIALNDLGERNAAVEHYESAIKLNPGFAEAYNNLGVTLYEMGLHDQAIKKQKKAISIAPGYTSAYHNLGNSYVKAGEKALAIETYEKALELSPNNPTYLFNLAIALSEAERLDDAISYYHSALQFKPDYEDVYNNLGCIYLEMERHSEAVENFRKLLTINPGYFKAHNNLGLAQRNLGQLEDSVMSFKQAIEIEPAYPNAHFNLGIALNDLGHYESAVLSYLKAIELNPVFTEAKHNLAGILSSIVIEQKQFSEQWAGAYLDLLNMPNMARPSAMAAQICQLLKLHPLLQEALSICKTKNGAAGLYSLKDKLSSLPLLLRTMELTALPDIELEKVLVTLRSSFLTVATSRDVRDDITPIQIALGLHCFTNEYVFAETESEGKLITELEHQLESGIAAKQPIDWFGLITLASYRPLIQYTWIFELYKSCQCIEPARPIFTTQIDNILEERRLRQSIPLLSSVSNEVSIGVQKQYEENPYPRWINTRFEIRARTLSEIVNESKLQLYEDNTLTNDAPEILIAGCGTGQHSLLTATRVKNSKVLAIDLSLSSLAYAKRKTQEYGITNIEYMQADILDLGKLNRQYDIVESVGVLHHMADPLKGWSVITDCLKPGGLMRLGLYSRTARQSVIRARARIKELGIGGSGAEIRAFRQEILGSEQQSGTSVSTDIKDFLWWTDFYTTSELRDLLFHVQEHQYSLPEIKIIIEQLGLKFAGFEFSHTHIRDAFTASYPDPKELISLDAWHQFELANPKTFAGMYQFWLQKIV
ncbi:MAG: tetratricopeptide repeat protein [Pseudohongiella sp.]|nr:tetratricopeptide repeat protein [Pseudohongiella sp.]